FPIATPGLPSVSAMPIAPLLEKHIAAKQKPDDVTWARQMLAKPVRRRKPRPPLPLLVPQRVRLAPLQRPGPLRPAGQSKPQAEQSPRPHAATPGAPPARQSRRRGKRTGRAPARSDRRCEGIARRVAAVAACAPAAARGSACVAAVFEAVAAV